ncbi:MAG: hypothetical protein BWY49_00727 [Candidatus Omnitrophica bacterium ADurb.Bin314]|nr:MAG: hypothetical protein BWY49_00727 [Candidatus Omnitrophica bacterium ADurb.Bin314]
MSDHGVHVNLILIADLRPLPEEGPLEDPVPGTDADAILDHDIRSYRVVRAEHNIPADHGRWMDGVGHCSGPRGQPLSRKFIAKTDAFITIRLF